MNKQAILIVDDDIDIVRSLEENIVEISTDCTIKISHDGKNALEILEKEKMDLMILDIQVPVMNGLQLLTELYNKGIWLPVVIITDSRLDEKNSKLGDYGIVDIIKKPFLPEEVVIRIDEIMRNREKKDLIKNLSLTSILQLIKMEERTGILTLKIGKENGRIFFKDGEIMDVKVKGLSTEKALEKFINSLCEEREISIEYIKHRKEKKIKMTLMEMVMEASRIKDEQKIIFRDAETGMKNRETLKNENLLKIAGLLDSLKEVVSYIVTDARGEVLKASSENYDEGVLNLSIYLWIIGDKMRVDWDLGELVNLKCYLKSGKKFIRKYTDYIIVLELSEMTKFPVFKEKLNELLKKMSQD